MAIEEKNRGKEATEEILANGLIVILRRVPLDSLKEVARALQEADVKVVEVALNSENALEQIRLLQRYDFCIGAGTVLEVREARAAIEAGAGFLFSPIHRYFLQSVAQKGKVLGIPGALTPAEVYHRYQEGAEFIKLFPTSVATPEYVRQLQGPFGPVRFIPTGGVVLNTAEAYFCAGVAAVAVGSAIVNPRLVGEARFSELRERAKAFVSLSRAFSRTLVQS